MRRLREILVLLCALNLAGSCSESGPGAASNPAPAGAVDEDADCNFETPLVPGVPGSPGHLIPSQRNPNGDSELSHLMRVFVEDLQGARERLRSGGAVEPLREKHKKMRCAWPTIPSQRNETYDALARSYLADVRAFDEAPSRERYNTVVQSCIACHSVTCGGVVDYLEALRWD